MQRGRYLSLVLISVLVISLSPIFLTGPAQPVATSLDNSKVSSISSDELASNPSFNPAIYVDYISYLRTLDGGYSRGMAEEVPTLSMYRLLSGLNADASVLQNFDDYLAERYRGSTGWYGIDRPMAIDSDTNNLELNSGLSTDNHYNYYSDFSAEILFLQRGNSYSSNQLTQLREDIDWRLQYDLQDLGIHEVYDIATLMSLTNSLTQTRIDLVTSHLANLQNTVVGDLNFGGFRYNLNDDNSIIISNTPYAFLIAEQLGVTADSVFDVFAAQSYVDSLMPTTLQTVSNNNMGLNYTLGFPISIYETYYPEDLFNGYDHPVEALYAGILSNILLRQYVPINYDINAGSTLALQNSLNTYWLDQDADLIIDRQPFHRYLGNYKTNNILSLVGEIALKWDLTSSMDLNLLNREIAPMQSERGGFVSTYSSSDLQSYNTVVDLLMDLDRKNLSYLNQSEIQRYIDYSNMYKLQSQDLYQYNYMGNTYQFYPTGVVNSAFEFYDISERGAVFNDYFINLEHNVQLLKNINEAGQLASVDSMFVDRLRDLTLFRFNTPLDQNSPIFDFEPSQIETRIDALSFFNLSSSLDTTLIVDKLETFQAISGGFIDYIPLNDRNTQFANNLLNFGPDFPQNLVLDFFKNQTYTTIDSQGIPYEVDANSIALTPTTSYVRFLLNSGYLQNYIDTGIIQPTKILTAFENFLFGSTFTIGSTTYTNVTTSWDQLPNYIEVSQIFGYSLSQITQNLAAININLTETLQYLADLQITSSTDPYIPNGGFDWDLASDGSTSVPDYEVAKVTYQVVKTFSLLNELNQIDVNLLHSFLSQYYITTNEYPGSYGLFRQNIYDNYAGLMVSQRLFKVAQITGFTTSIDISNTIINRLNNNDYGSFQVAYYPWEFMIFAGMIGYGGLEVSDFDSNKVIFTMNHIITDRGNFIDELRMEESYTAAKILTNLGLDTSNSMVQDLVSFVVNQQRIFTDNQNTWDNGGFSGSPYYSWSSYQATFEAVATLRLFDSVEAIDVNAAVDYVLRSSQDIQNADYYWFSIEEIAAQVHTFAAFDNLIFPSIDYPEFAEIGDQLTIFVTPQDIKGDIISDTYTEVKLENTLIGQYTIYSNGISVEIDTSSFTEGWYTFNVSISKADYIPIAVTLPIYVAEQLLSYESISADTQVGYSDTFRASGVVTTALGDNPSGLEYNFTVLGPADLAHSLNLGYSSGSGEVSIFLNVDDTPVSGNYTLLLTMSFTDYGSITVEFQFERLEEGNTVTSDPTSETSETTDTDPTNTNSTNGEQPVPEIELPGFEFVMVFAFLAIAVPIRRAKFRN